MKRSLSTPRGNSKTSRKKPPETVTVYSVVTGQRVLHRVLERHCADAYCTSWNEISDGLPGFKPARIVVQKAVLRPAGKGVGHA